MAGGNRDRMTACRHTYRPDPLHPGYVVCCACGTYKSTVAPPPEQVYTASYWSHERGHSTIAEQVHNVETHTENGVSKNDFILSLIDVEDRSAALEIGCAPGALLGRLKRDAGFEWVVGMEGISDRAVLNEIRNVAIEAGGWPYEVYGGFFPCPSFSRVYGTVFDLIVAADVFEHSHEPEAFLAECARLLKPGGQLLLMLPLALDDTPEQMWLADEHVYLHSPENMGAMLSDAGFEWDGDIHRWTAGHECVSARRAA